MRFICTVALAIAVTGSLLSTAAIAVDQTTQPSTVIAESASTGTIARVTDLMGVRVYNTQNENLGKIENLAIDPASGKIRYAVLSFGGFLGMGDKLFAVPWNSLRLVPKGTSSANTEKQDYYVLDVSKDSLKNAPGFDKKGWPDFADANWVSKVEKFYGTQKAERGSTTR